MNDGTNSENGAGRYRRLEPRWEYVSDQVMGGISEGGISHEIVAGQKAVRLTGEVSLENGGGFVQMAFDLASASGDARPELFDGLEITVLGNGADYEMRLRTNDLTRPWQSFRSALAAGAHWRRLRLPFAGFMAHRTEKTFEPARLRRVGVLAVGQEMHADISVAEIGLYGGSELAGQ